MILFVNDKNEIKDVNTTDKNGLKAIIIDDKDNPFKGWSVARICCYKVQLIKNRIVGYSPYIDTKIVEQLDRLGFTDERNEAEISDNRDGIIETFENSMINTDDIALLREGLEEVYELLLESEE